ncbi:MAG: phosphoribosylamine--glycine ligase [Defluviitaleaceae bacterium]|nr:phosphoribosylamine--glycine ligase [Defluviitaleaceae bacterium]
MKVLVVGSGGREDAICWKLAQSPIVSEIHIAPGNPSMGRFGRLVDIKAGEHALLADYATENQIGLTVCGPDDAVVGGIGDVFRARGLRIFAPSAAAARLEGSKAHAKAFMEKYGIPTAGYGVYYDFESAMAYCEKACYPLVVKVDGLALGKGVSVCGDVRHARIALQDVFLSRRFGASGERVIIEEFLEGREVSILCFCDGKNILPMASATDYKRAYDGDRGPNTGGMGVISPSPFYTDEDAQIAAKLVLEPTMAGLINDGTPFVGCLFVQLMLTPNGHKVIEYNCRFGDPETQAVLPRLENDFAEILIAACDGELDKITLKWRDEAVCCVVGASMGYPGEYARGARIDGLDEIHNNEETLVFHAGTRPEDGGHIAQGGRVFAISALGSDLSAARNRAYVAMEKITSDGIFFRKDIGS